MPTHPPVERLNTGLSEDIRRVCRRRDIKTVLKTPFTLHHKLMRVKDTDPLEKRAGVVYQLPCSECESSYTGETKRPLETRLRDIKLPSNEGKSKCLQLPNKCGLINTLGLGFVSIL